MNRLKKKNLHVIFFAVLLIIIIIIAAKIMIWNLGIDSVYDPDHLEEGFDSEVNDSLIYSSGAKEDDGIYNVLLIGNSTFCDSNGLNKLPDLIAQKTNANIYTVAFPDVIATSYTDANINPTGIDAFSFSRLCYALATNDYYNQDQNIETVAEQYGSYYKEALASMKAVDMTTIDTIVIYYDGSDYFARLGLYNPDDIGDIKTFKGSFYSGIKRLQEAYPEKNIILGSIHYSPYVDDEGNYLDSNEVNLGNGEYFGFVQMQVEAAAALSVSFIDNYIGSIHDQNYTQYLSDHIHLNDQGMELLAERLSSFINQFN